MTGIARTAVQFTLASVLWLLASHSARAQLLDDIEIAPVDNNAEIRIKLTAPVRYLRHFPPERGEIINVYFRLASVDNLELPLLREEKRKSPPTPLVPPFTVMFTSYGTIDSVSDLYLAIQFKQPVSFKLRQGNDSRSFILTIPASHAQPKPATRVASGSGGPSGTIAR